MSVAVVRYNQTLAALRQAVELCDGFSDLKPGSRVVLKPNMVLGGRKSQRPDGIVTTVNLIEEVVTLLREFNCDDITIADGGVIHPEINLNTPRAFEWSGLADLAKRLDLPIVDLNEGPFVSFDFEGVKIEIAKIVLEADFVINLPVLKTHQLTKVSLGLKNLKGVLHEESKKKFHRYGLEHFIAMLGTKIPAHLTIIDGTYATQKGPVGNDIHRMDLLIAGKNILEADIVGANILGIDPSTVGHIVEYAQMTNQKIDLDKIRIQGEKLTAVQKKLEWESAWPQDLMQLYGISGVHMETPGYSNCSGCGMGIFVALNNFFRENTGARFEDVEICAGLEPVASPEAKKVFCLGKCACQTNKAHPNAVKIGGCPPSVKRTYDILKKNLLP
ncbi:MAG TPA: DUF362 domain-containing protein [Desulfitobacteriaceae bacterium]|nr:DUF362 domain-containing protein [Desulfitobacteriaceae bacterium]